MLVCTNNIDFSNYKLFQCVFILFNFNLLYYEINVVLTKIIKTINFTFNKMLKRRDKLLILETELSHIYLSM